MTNNNRSGSGLSPERQPWMCSATKRNGDLCQAAAVGSDGLCMAHRTDGKAIGGDHKEYLQRRYAAEGKTEAGVWPWDDPDEPTVLELIQMMESEPALATVTIDEIREIRREYRSAIV